MIIDNIIQEFKDQGVELNSGTFEKDISDLELHLNFKFKDDFKEFYKKVNGFKKRDWTKGMFSIFPLERIKEEYDLKKGKNSNINFIPFCDFLINSHWLGFLRDKEGVYKYDDEPEKISNTFEETLLLILEGSEKIY
ncbi:SMI1/KNR4 family protein [Flavivirga aquimarina]|uniref:SMI1/KNR4 family protein n=1 Tax=Flavivirga aquimarina TaxID=2027862 RepID=A0ABT8WGW5_9FLAO|nr:SMI1/KNR4 family protein [Flavivirga aquimarina]MDO5972322.1 SMI1/KNR4 family protein [Flavivirga aquimarina]